MSLWRTVARRAPSWATRPTQARTVSTASSAGAPSPRSVPCFAFDIDGVLLKDNHEIGRSREALRRVLPVSQGGLHPTGLPHIFLTNGGGVTEATRAQQLSEVFGLPFDASQVCLSHSPMQTLVPEFGSRPVCVIGMHDLKLVAAQYGFRHVTTPRELAAQFPILVPHSRYDADGPRFPAAAAERALQDEAAAHALAQVAAVLVMHDPRDWYVDLQIALDLLLAKRRADLRAAGLPDSHFGPIPAPAPASAALSHHPPLPHEHPHLLAGSAALHAHPAELADSSDGHTPAFPHTPLFMSNADLLYSTAFRAPRLAGGAFVSCLAQLFAAVSGTPLRPQVFGKPSRTTYRFAEGLLARQRDRIAPGAAIATHYGIGDNPAADLAGANLAGPAWTSVFVRTGTLPLTALPSQQPARQFADVCEAVTVLSQEHGVGVHDPPRP